MRALRCCLLVSFCALIPCTAFAWPGSVPAKSAEWPQWRGPNRDAVSADKGLLQTWPSDGPPLAWKTRGLCGGLASVVLSDGKLFTMGRRQGNELLLALDAENGKELWSARISSGQAENPSSTPTVDGERVFALSSHGDLVAVESATGKELWRRSHLEDFGGSVPTWKFCESPLVDGDKLICTPGSREATLVALNKKTGAVIWKASTPNGGGNGHGYSSPVISHGAGVKQYVQVLGAGTGCIGVEAETGRVLWNYAKVGNGTATIPTAIVEGDFVFCTSGYDTGSALLQLVRAGSGVKAQEKYFLKGNVCQNHHGGMIRIGDHIFGGHGHNNGFPICVEMKSGRIAWGGNQRGPGSGSAAVVYADGQLYFRYDNGLMALISATTSGYKLNGTFQIPEVKGPSWSHPVVVGGKLYLREQDNLFVYQVTAGEK
jgi:outer membrane protein assembly factor BamB